MNPENFSEQAPGTATEFLPETKFLYHLKINGWKLWTTSFFFFGMSFFFKCYVVFFWRVVLKKQTVVTFLCSGTKFPKTS